MRYDRDCNNVNAITRLVASPRRTTSDLPARAVVIRTARVGVGKVKRDGAHDRLAFFFYVTPARRDVLTVVPRAPEINRYPHQIKVKGRRR